MGETTPTRAGHSDRYIVPGLVRGLEVLQAFTPERPRLNLREIAAATGVTRSAVFRIAYTLTQLGILVHDSESQQYAVGAAALRLGYGCLAPRALIEAAIGPLEALHAAVGWSAHLGALDGAEIVYLLRAPARLRQASLVRVGGRLPAHSTSMGRVLIAQLSEAEIVALFRGARLGGAGARKPLAALIEQARQDRVRGYVLHKGEFQRGVTSVAAPVADASGRKIAAINVAGAAAEAAEPDGPVVRAVLATAATISRILGLPGEAP